MDTTPTAQPTPTSSDADASIAYLTAVVRADIDDPRKSDGDAFATAVVKALSHAHPHVRLEDAPHLAGIIESPPPDLSTAEAIEYIIVKVCSELEEWNWYRHGWDPGHD